MIANLAGTKLFFAIYIYIYIDIDIDIDIDISQDACVAQADLLSNLLSAAW